MTFKLKQDVRWQISDAGYQIPDAGYQMPDTECRISDVAPFLEGFFDIGV